MLVIIQSGARKGQRQDLAPAIAQAMLDDGRAVLAFPDQFPAPPASVKLEPAPVKKKGRHAHN